MSGNLVPSLSDKISVIIPTKNEEKNIVECIKSVKWADEIFVLDSYSSDNTVNHAKKLGTNIIQRQFDNFSSHKNWALDHIDFRNEWVLIIDADERVSEELFKEIMECFSQPSHFVGYYIPRKNFFMGKWIKHGGWYPDWQLRLFKHKMARYENRLVHEHMIVTGPVSFMNSALIHQDFKGLNRLFERINVYSTLEAEEAFKIIKKDSFKGEKISSSFFKKGPHRRRFLKEAAYRYLPFRFLFKFIWMYFIKLGFLDGRIGLIYCSIHAIYEYQVSLKLEELIKKGANFHEK